MGSIVIANIALDMIIQLSLDEIQAHLASSPVVVGETLARQVDTCARREGLGYYPPLAYFADSDCVDQDLLTVSREIAWFVCEYARGRVRRQLRPVFSTVHVEQVRVVSFSMPQVRMTDEDPVAALAAHYTPDTVRVSAIVSSIEKEPVPEGIERIATGKALDWLGDAFARVEVASSARVA